MSDLSMFTTEEVAYMQDLIDINEQIKILEDKKKKISDKIKASMINAKVDKVEYLGKTIQIIESTRKTVTKSTKDTFIAELIGKGKQNLVVHSIEPDVESIFAEVDAGTLDKDFVDNYIRVTPVTTLRCS